MSNKLHRIHTPSGRPPFMCPMAVLAPEAANTPDESVGSVEGDEAEALNLSGEHGLLTGSEALSNAVSGDVTFTAKPIKAKGLKFKGPAAPEVEGVEVDGLLLPSDETIKAWGLAVRKHCLAADEGLMTVTALQYWVRYTYDPARDNKRWTAVRARLEELIS